MFTAIPESNQQYRWRENIRQCARGYGREGEASEGEESFSFFDDFSADEGELDFHEASSAVSALTMKCENFVGASRRRCIAFLLPLSRF